MPKIAYRDWPSRQMNAEHQRIIEQADAFARQYAQQGYSLTLRQLYYRFVAAGAIANKMSEYKRLGDLIADARYAGYIDWNHLEDRTRNARSQFHFTDSRAIIRQSAYGFSTAKWDGQDARVEVWVEKDALVDVVQRAATAMDVTYFSCRGYTSASEMWGAAQRLKRYMEETDQDGEPVRPYIIHLGDHDPSGIDMTIDIEARLVEFLYRDLEDDGLPIPEWLEQFGWYTNEKEPQQAYAKAIVDGEIEPALVRRVALNLDQIRQYNPPPNPAKTTDSRYDRYVNRTGLKESWELDALEPAVLDQVIRTNVQALLDVDKFNAKVEEQREGRAKISKIFADHYEEIMVFAGEQGWSTDGDDNEQ